MFSLLTPKPYWKRTVRAARFTVTLMASTLSMGQAASAQEFDVLRSELMTIFTWNVESGIREDSLLGARLTIDENCGMSSLQTLDLADFQQTMSSTEVLGNLRHVDPAQLAFSGYGGGVMAASLRIAEGGVDWIGGGLVLAEDPFFERISSDLDSGFFQGSCTETECVYSRRFRFLDVLAAPEGIEGREPEVIGMFTSLIEQCQTLSADEG